MARGRKTRGRALHGVLLVDKPAGASSNRVLQQVRRSLDARKAGHAGTLDPLATGMLPVLLGEATKLAGYLIDADKAYETTLKLGVETDSLDADGEVTRRRAVPQGLDVARVDAIAEAFRGAQRQVPPMVSAIKVDGQRLYQAARQGLEIERRARDITIHELRVLEVSGDTLRLAVRCSKGTYIRVLGAELGERLGCGAHVQALRRTWVAPFESSAMHTPEAIAEAGDACLLPPDAGLAHLPRVAVDETGLAALRRGQGAPVLPGSVSPPLPGPASPASGAVAARPDPMPTWRVYGPDGALVALGALRADGIVMPSRVLQLDPNGGGPDRPA